MTGPNSAKRWHLRRQLAARDGASCFYCGRPFASLDEATLDHLIPFREWRTWRQVNLVLACYPCNQAKADRLPQAFLRPSGFAPGLVSLDVTPPADDVTADRPMRLWPGRVRFGTGSHRGRSAVRRLATTVADLVTVTVPEGRSGPVSGPTPTRTVRRPSAGAFPLYSRPVAPAVTLRATSRPTRWRTPAPPSLSTAEAAWCPYRQA